VGARPSRWLARARHDGAANEAELTVSGAGALIDHPADALGKSAAAGAVEHDLGHRRLSGEGFAARFVVDGGGETIDGARQDRRRGGAGRRG
jgi:hypothetical protein